jgi:hypothetical protein
MMTLLFYSVTVPLPSNVEKAYAWYQEQLLKMVMCPYENNPYEGFHWQVLNSGLYISVCTHEQDIVDRSFEFIQRYLIDMKIKGGVQFDLQSSAEVLFKLLPGDSKRVMISQRNIRYK